MVMGLESMLVKDLQRSMARNGLVLKITRHLILGLSHLEIIMIAMTTKVYLNLPKAYLHYTMA